MTSGLVAEGEGALPEESADLDHDRVFAALANADRRAILEYLRIAPGGCVEGMSVSRIAAHMEISRFSARHHLEVLRAAGLIRIEVRHTRRISILEVGVVAEAVDWLLPFTEV